MSRTPRAALIGPVDGTGRVYVGGRSGVSGGRPCRCSRPPPALSARSAPLSSRVRRAASASSRRAGRPDGAAARSRTATAASARASRPSLTFPLQTVSPLQERVVAPLLSDGTDRTVAAEHQEVVRLAHQLVPD